MQRDIEKNQIWKQKIEDWKSSGLSQQKWCVVNGEKLHKFKYWQMKFQEKANPSISFQELKDTKSFPIQIFKGKISICFPNGLDQKTFKDTIEALEELSC